MLTLRDIHTVIKDGYTYVEGQNSSTEKLQINHKTTTKTRVFNLSSLSQGALEGGIQEGGKRSKTDRASEEQWRPVPSN